MATRLFITSSFSCVALILALGYKLEEILKTIFSLHLGNQRHAEAKCLPKVFRNSFPFLPSFLRNVNTRCILCPQATSASDPAFELPFPLRGGHASVALQASIP